MEVFRFTLLLAAFLLANFAVFSLGGWWLFYRVLAPSIPHRAIHQTQPTAQQIRHEIVHALLTQGIFLVMGVGLWQLQRLGFTQIQTGPVQSWSLFLLQFFLMQLPHDAYFYWTHRAMHELRWLRPFHHDHHRSQPPTPFAAYSFHPVEAVIHGLFWYLVAFLIPIHVFWLFAFYAFMSYINMWGHTGYEFWHKDLLEKPIQRILNTPTHHNLHHKYHNKNFGIYYNFWDTLCGTNHHKYAEEYRAIKATTERHKTSRILKALGL